MLIGWRGGRRTGAKLGLAESAEEAWPSAQEGARGSGRPTCLPASRSGGRARQARAGLQSAVRGARSPAPPQANLAPRAP